MAVVSSAIATPISGAALAAATASSISCNWSSAAEVVAQIQEDKLNVTDIVAQCANVCQVAFESSSAAGALAGEGIMISYLLQVALACLFGALFPIFIWLINLSSRKIAIRRVPLLRKLQKSVYEVNAFFSISLLVASIVRWRQVPSIMETVLLSYVVWVQLLIISCMLFAQLSDNVMNNNHLGWEWHVYYFAIGIAQLVTSCVIEVPHRSVYKELATQCHNQHQFIDVSTYIPASSKGIGSLTWLIIGMVGGLVLGFLSGFLSATLGKITPKWLRKHGETIFLIVVLLLNLTSVVSNTIVTEYVRSLLKKMTGDQLPDHGWSYGQTTAILLWIPFFWTVLKETMKHLREKHSNQQTGDKMQTLGGESVRPTGMEPVPPPYTPQKGTLLEVDQSSGL